MSRTTERELEIPKGVDVSISKKDISVKGPHGQLSVPLVDGVDVNQENGKVLICTSASTRQARAMTGTLHALVRNMVKGVSEKWEKKLQIEGVGYRAQLQGNRLVMQLGYSHPVEYDHPDGIEIKVNTPTEISVSGIDRQKVGQTAAEIRSKRPPEPYKGKGVRYWGEYIKRKEVKK